MNMFIHVSILRRSADRSQLSHPAFVFTSTGSIHTKDGSKLLGVLLVARALPPAHA